MTANPVDTPVPPPQAVQVPTAFLDAIPTAFSSLHLADLKDYLDGLRAQGVRELRGYCEAHPEILSEITKRVKVNAINRAMIDLFDVSEQNTSSADFARELTLMMMPAGYQILEAIAGGKPFFNDTLHCQTRCGQPLILVVSMTVPMASYSTVLIGAEDVTVRQTQARDLARAQADFRNIVINNRSGIVILDKDGAVLFANPAAQTLLGRTIWELQGTQIGVPLVAGRNTEIDIIRSGKGIGIAEMTVSETEWEGQPALLAMLHDITDRKQAHTQAQYMAHHDPLTGLPNRLLFYEQVNSAVFQAKLEHHALAVLFVDLDNFKAVNDSRGHAIGDRLLAVVGKRLSSCVRKTDIVARIGGDEFTVLIEIPKDNPHSPIQVATNILTALDKPFNFDGQQFVISASIGISCYPEDGEDVETLMQRADIAMYNAKRQGRNRYACFGNWPRAREKWPKNLEDRITKALENSQLLLHYQPQIDIRSGRIIGVEALLRWQDPHQGLVLPDSFLSALEDSPLLENIGEWVLQDVCGQGALWQRLVKTEHFHIGVNLAARQLDSRRTVDMFTQIMRLSHLDPHCLEVEVNEQALLVENASSTTTLGLLAASGMQITLDRFGSGPASLTCLTRYPITALKIDRSLVHRLTQDTQAAVVVCAMIAMAHALGLTVIAQGVETPEQLRWLREHGCDRAQGYALVRPLPAEAITPLLQTDRPLC